MELQGSNNAVLDQDQLLTLFAKVDERNAARPNGFAGDFKQALEATQRQAQDIIAKIAAGQQPTAAELKKFKTVCKAVETGTNGWKSDIETQFPLPRGEQIQTVLDFYDCVDSDFVPYEGGIIPYCFWKNEQIGIYKYSGLDKSFMAGIVDDLYKQYEGLKNIDKLVKNINNNLEDVIFAYTRAFVECSNDALTVKEADFLFYSEKLTELTERSGVWNLILEKIRLHQLGKVADDIVTCNNAEETREQLNGIIGFIQNQENIKTALENVITRSKKFFKDFTDTDRNETRYLHGQLVAEAITLVVPMVNATKGARVGVAIEEVETKLPQLETELAKIVGKIRQKLITTFEYGEAKVFLEDGITQVGSGFLEGHYVKLEINVKIGEEGVKLAKGSEVFNEIFSIITQKNPSTPIMGISGTWMDGLADNLNTFNNRTFAFVKV